MIDFDAIAARTYPDMVATDAKPAPAAPVTLATTDPAKPAPVKDTPASTPAQPAQPAQRRIVQPAPAAITTKEGIEIPSEALALRALDPEREVAEKLFGGTPNSDILRAFTNPDALARAAALGVSKETATAVAVETSKIQRDLGVDDIDMAGVVRRAAQLQHNPPDRQAAIKETMVLLTSEYGAEGAAAAFNEAKKLAARDPRVLKLLDATGLGNDPETILILARRARSERGAGRLK